MQTQQKQQIFGQESVKENGDIRPADTAPKSDGGQLKPAADIIDIKALQRKRAQAEFTR